MQRDRTIQLDRSHLRAIISEFGDRLRHAYGEDTSLPESIAAGLGRLRAIEEIDKPENSGLR